MAEWSHEIRMLSNLEANSNKTNKVFRWVQANMEFAPPGSEHYMTASHTYYQNLLRWSNIGARNPLPIKDVANPSDSIQCIDHIFTPESSRNYLQEMKKFKIEGKSIHQRLLFHGTQEECVLGIIEVMIRIITEPNNNRYRNINSLINFPQTIYHYKF